MIIFNMGRWNEKSQIPERLWIKRILVGLFNLACHDVIFNFWIGGWMMPLSIVLKEPKISVFAKEGEPEIQEIAGIKMAMYAQLESGQPMWIPPENISMIEVMTGEEIEKMKKIAEERRKQMERGPRLPTAKFIGPNPGGFASPGGKRRH